MFKLILLPDLNLFDLTHLNVAANKLGTSTSQNPITVSKHLTTHEEKPWRAGRVAALGHSGGCGGEGDDTTLITD